MAAAPLTDRVRDDELLTRVAAGDAAAFTDLFRRRQPDVFRFAVHMTGSVAISEDVVQDVFLVVMRDAARYEAGRASVAAWLCGIARNCVRQRLERDRRLTSVDFANDVQEPVSEMGGPMDPLTDLLKAERIETLRRAVQTLPLPYREAVVLCDLQGLPYADAAAAVGCPVGTVRSRLHRARTMLAAKLAVSGLSPVAADTDGRSGAAVAGAGWRVPVRQTNRGVVD
jgi:RNA polymerase sigma-70 factor (ECF subfamily)